MIELRIAGRIVVPLALVLCLAACGGDDDGGGAPDPLVLGPYPVGVTRIELVDPEQERTLLTEVWYPADESARDMEPASLESYLPAGLEDLADNATVPTVAVRDAVISPDAPFPLVAFSHGNGGIRFQNSFQCEHLASHGYVVIAPDHDHNTFFDNSGNQAELAIARPLDMIFLFDSFSALSEEAGSPFEGWIDLGRGFGITGHSFGAFTSLATASMDDRIVAVLPMAFSGPVSDSYDAATFLMLATEDKTIGLANNEAIRTTYETAPPPRYLAEIIDAGHYSFSFACQVGLPGPWNGDGCGDDTRFADGSPFTFTDDLRVWDIVDGYSAAFFGRYIKGILEYDEVLATNLDPEVVLYAADPGDTAMAASSATAR